MSIELKNILAGKLDHDYLAVLIERYTQSDPHLLQGARIGEDATVIDAGERVIVLKTDPITFSTSNIGYYAVHVNANDVLCMGATPKWFLATILVPVKFLKQDLESMFEQISTVCRKEQIVYCGGHTEAVEGLKQPIVAGMMVGEASHKDVLLKRKIQKGDRILLANRIPIEGTALLGYERSDDLETEFSADFAERCRKLLFDPGISVRTAADIVRKTGLVRAMHDPTEGGLATALHELAQASNLGLECDVKNIDILPEGKLICDFYNLDPMGVLASGALLIVTEPDHADAVLQKLDQHAVPAVDIGFMTETQDGVLMKKGDDTVQLPIYPRDEIIKALS